MINTLDSYIEKWIKNRCSARLDELNDEEQKRVLKAAKDLIALHLVDDLADNVSFDSLCKIARVK